MSLRKNIYTLLLVLFAITAQARQIDYHLLNKRVIQYKKAEWDINLSTAFTTPYDQQDISLDLEMISPSGKPVILPCYFEEGESEKSIWKARFAAQENGEYSYHFVLKSKAGEVKSAEEHFNVEASAKPGFLHKNTTWTFRFDNGKLFRGIGENVAWESRKFEDDKWTYDHLLPTLAKNGANFFRTWMCYWNLPLEWKKVSSTKRYSNTDQYFNPGAIKRMDELVNMTDSLGLYFMLTLDWHGHLMENGGWKNSPYNVINGGPAKTSTEFFSSQKAKEKYKNKLRYIIARWGYSTNIAAFEFFNEVDNAAFNKEDSILIPHQYITQWHDDMSRYLKDIDPYHHLVTTSISHRDIQGLNSVAYFDFNQKHIYKHTEKIPAIYPPYIKGYGKPYVVGEFGYRWEDADPKYAKEADFDFKRGLWYGLFSETPLLPMSWWWELFDDEKMAYYFKGVRSISDAMLKAGNGGFKQIAVSAGKIEAYSMHCGNQYFIYLLNNTDRTTDAPVNLPVMLNKFSVQSFSPETGEYKTEAAGRLPGKDVTLSQVNLHPKEARVLIISDERR
ncbi:DUF5060 domain-containing protein [Mucilaginibacter rubeus]|uniref:DUF5060 domain-containing protein n=1 Tax=Mucilaginibacter rubeus TaxID=2027860 RepID=A0AAE6JDS4_9SPHI|nr:MULTISPECIES: DUF5060 domain-containing protein [Mucilaginibacter]QEM03777.1 DUF5060 domain-containing protein [Mucilaginibacter rubeus]QEM16389.1 DUF5060 domain-containing protein [Mucilaginibacter gossypii]QTE40844.1 DUF5060 domain-containing protein [Mucilaginibacter rubeus]QTE47447.1 DUF5060 domain-containing protein [Mucilaginibacter rubeus]QTE58840.1 DUF5060 domain-containing protein [Mucilaginibacter rubeus]